jgi:hypothetical protein
MKMNRKGMTGVEVLVALAVIAAVTFVAKPSLFPGHSKRAAVSTETTARLEAATQAQGGTAAASIVKIGEANAGAEPSRSRDFIAREVPLALSLLPSPDPAALLEAEKRRVAVMEGRLDEVLRLYETATSKAERMQQERDEALAARRAADLALEKAAAAEHARTLQAMGAGIVAVLALALFAYAKLYGISLSTAGRIAADHKAGMPLITALDTHLAPRLHAQVNRAARLAAP